LAKNIGVFCSNCCNVLQNLRKTPIVSPKIGKNRRKLWS
jgi:hypothetical protein